MIDFHNHLIPGVDDGATDADEARESLHAFREQGVSALVTTPHVLGSDTMDPTRLAARLATLDRGWSRLLEAAGTETVPALHRGAEVMLDAPEIDLSDPRLRLAGTRSVLVEFPYMTVPPNAERTLFAIRMAGWEPVIAHPERYANGLDDVSDVEAWKRVGARMQVNAASLLGRYGERSHRLGWRLLHRGLADYVASDHHGRGTLHLAACRAEVERRGGEAAAALLFEENARRLLDGRPPLEVPPVLPPPPSFWRRILGGDRRR
jgi:protein-tyrosine phosphatase